MCLLQGQKERERMKRKRRLGIFSDCLFERFCGTVLSPCAAHTHTHARTHTDTHTHTCTHTLSCLLSSYWVQPNISRYTGEALARLSSRPWISLMLSLMCGSLCQQPSIRSYTSLGQVLGRCSTLPWVIHSITCRGRKTRHQLPDNA